jgi:hypothetical protein
MIYQDTPRVVGRQHWLRYSNWEHNRTATIQIHIRAVLGS